MTTDTSDARILNDQTNPNPLAGIASLSAPDAAELVRSPTALLTAAELTVIANADDRAMAVDDLSDIASRKKALDERRRTIADPLRKAKEAVDALFKPAADLLERADASLRAKVLAFDRAEAARAAEARRKAEEEAREATRKAAEEAAAAAAKAEADARAIQAQAEAAAQAGDYAAAAAHELAAATVQAEAQQSVSAAAAASYAPRAPAFTAPLKTGTATRKTYKATLDSDGSAESDTVALLALVRHVAQHPEHVNLLTLDTKAANKLASALQTAMRVPGLRVIEDESLAVRKK